MFTSLKKSFRTVHVLKKKPVFLSSKKNYFALSFKDDDKFSKELKDYPLPTSDTSLSFNTGIKYAKDLFREAYNRGELGYTKLSLELVSNYLQKSSFSLDNEEVFKYFHEHGVSDLIVYGTLIQMQSLDELSDFQSFVESFNDIYGIYVSKVEGVFTSCQYTFNVFGGFHGQIGKHILSVQDSGKFDELKQKTESDTKLLESLKNY